MRDRFDLARRFARVVEDHRAYIVGLEGVADADRNGMVDGRFDGFRM
jgi:hypothetical protein